MGLRGFEFEDQPWFPSSLRRWQMDYIRFSVSLLRPYKKMKPPFESTVERQEWLDLASGSGGPLIEIHKAWQKRTKGPLIVHRSDRFPNDETILELDVLEQPLPKANGYTMFNAFHHFDRDQQASILSKMSKGDWALVAEPLNRNLFTFLGVFLLTGPLHFVLAPFVSPFSWRRIFFTYLIPIVPVVTCWDGLVSVLRTPTLGHLRHLAEEASNLEYQWKAIAVPFVFGRVAILVGNRTLP